MEVNKNTMKDCNIYNKNPYLHVVNNSVDLTDNFGYVRYTINIEEITSGEDFEQYGRCYSITVLSYCYGEEPQVLVSQYENDYPTAMKLYSDNIKNYTALIAAETRNVQDISIYANRIGYKIINPDCCKNCKYVNKIHTVDNKYKFVCMNKEMFDKILSGLEVFSSPTISKNDPLSHPHTKDYNKGECRHSSLTITPEVNPFGLCDNYVNGRVTEEMKPKKHSQWTFVNHDCATPEAVIETITKYEVNKALNSYDENIELVSGGTAEGDYHSCGGAE